MTTGIYALYWAEQDNNIYIGKSATSIEGRYAHHCSELRLGTHYNIQLQEAYFTYKTLPIITIIEELHSLDNSMYDALEISWIKEFDSYRNGLNRTPGGDSNNYGQDNHLSKYPNDTIIKAFLELYNNPGETQKSIAKRINISLAVLGSIAKGSRHGWLSNKFPVEYAGLISRKRSKMGTSIERGITLPKIVSPTGEVYTVTNMCSFAKEHGLSQPGLWGLMNYKAASHKKWRRVIE